VRVVSERSGERGIACTRLGVTGSSRTLESVAATTQASYELLLLRRVDRHATLKNPVNYEGRSLGGLAKVAPSVAVGELGRGVLRRLPPRPMRLPPGALVQRQHGQLSGVVEETRTASTGIVSDPHEVGSISEPFAVYAPPGERHPQVWVVPSTSPEKEPAVTAPPHLLTRCLPTWHLRVLLHH
jgi:hypothetical protein